MATRHFCAHNVTPHCTGRDGQPGRGPSRCKECWSPIYVQEGVYGVFFWRADNRYPLDDAIKVYERPSAAERWTHGTELVVRFIAD